MRISNLDATTVIAINVIVMVIYKALRGRDTDAEEVILKRIGKAEFELSKSVEFDYTVVNDDLLVATNEVAEIIENFLK